MSYLDEVLINFSSSRLELLLSERLGLKDEPEKQKSHRSKNMGFVWRAVVYYVYRPVRIFEKC